MSDIPVSPNMDSKYINAPNRNRLGHRDLQGKVAVVTGASSGIGRATALELGRRGANVIIHGNRNLEGLQQTSRLLMAQRVSTQVVTADLTRHDSCLELVNSTYHWQQRIDIWVNNAGADILTGSVAKAPFHDKLDLLWNVDVRATITLGRMVGSRMLEQPPGNARPVIINIGWDQAIDGIEGDAGMLFGPTKAAVMAFSQALAQSLAPDVRVNCIAPGWIKTKWGAESSDYWNTRAHRESLSNRWGEADDIAAAIGFLVSSQADFLNGVILPINGGQRCYADSKTLRATTGH